MPTRQDWLFSLRTFAAAMLALWIGLASGLDRPYWAMATVYIASQPLSGATRSKAVYRLLGTLLGASAAVVLVPALVNAPALLSVAMALWTALCLTLSLLDRTPRSYVFMLAGYTAAIVGFPSVGAPGEVFTTALSRSEEIGLGIVCASVMASLVFPRHVGPVVAQRMDQWLRDGRQWALDVLEGVETAAGAREARRKLAADAVDLGMLGRHLAFDTSRERGALRAFQALHGEMSMLLPLLSSISDRLGAVRSMTGTGAIDRTLERVADWVRLGSVEAEAGALHEAIEAAAPALDERSGWDAIVLAGLVTRLHELVDWRLDCGRLQAHLRAGLPGLPVLSGGAEPDVMPALHRDVGMALLSGFSAGLAVLLVCWFWIAAGWPEGFIAAEMAAVACCFFAAQDNPVPAILSFMRWTAVAVVIDGLYLFAILPLVGGFEMLAMVLAPAFLVFGALAARPATAPIGMALAANGATLLALQESYAADFASFVNAGIATILGLLAAALITQVIRSVGAEVGLRRLSRAHWTSLAQAAEERGAGNRAAFARLVLDRLGLAAPRLAALPDSSHQGSDALAELRAGLNIVDLRRAREGLPKDVVVAIDRVLAGVAVVFRDKAAGATAEVARQALLGSIDAAIGVAVGTGMGSARRDALLGLAGLRRALFADATAYRAHEHRLDARELAA